MRISHTAAAFPLQASRAWQRFVAQAVVSIAVMSGAVHAQPLEVRVAVSDVLAETGLLPLVAARFQAATGMTVRALPMNSARALETVRQGGADVMWLDARDDEDRAVREGHAVRRIDVMLCEVVLVGPPADPAAAQKSVRDAISALKSIAAVGATYVAAPTPGAVATLESSLWNTVAPGVLAVPRPRWFRNAAVGADGAARDALRAAAAMGAYTMTDRATWLSARRAPNEARGLQLMVEGDPRLFVSFGTALVSPARHASVRQGAGQAFVDWLSGPDGQNTIAAWRIDAEQPCAPSAPRRAASGMPTMPGMSGTRTPPGMPPAPAGPAPDRTDPPGRPRQPPRNEPRPPIETWPLAPVPDTPRTEPAPTPALPAPAR